jgi:endonuclease/exonuclease/phosphatase (EEP) superfamily protein YafD
MSALSLILSGLAVLWIVATALPLARTPFWWVRMFDFPRAQIAAGAVLTLVAYAATRAVMGELVWWDGVLLGLLGVAVAYQLWRMLPYSPAWTPRVVRASPEARGDRSLRLVVSNVLMQNREGDRWLAVVRDADPDVLAAVETDAWWAETARGLESELPHAVEVPQDDTYGMILRSRLPIRECQVRHFVEDSVPSIDATLELASGEPLRLLLLHPRPPRPDIQQDSRLRDAELVRAAREVADPQIPTIVAGDLNDVAWSYTTSLFQRISGFLDPRIGRGMFATFHAERWWLRYPLDHIFHSDDLGLVGMKRLDAVGSDHFPMCVELSVDPDKRPLQEGPDLDEDDEEEAEEAVEEAEEQLEEETPEDRQQRQEEDR